MKNFPLYRITVIVTMFLKFVIQLYFFHKKHKTWTTNTYDRWQALLKKQAVEYRENAIKLEGLMIKVGQFLSTRADIMPDVFLNELADLIDKVPPVPSNISKKILEAEWGQSLDSHLSYISDKPVASASIGEVYKGTLLNGQDVAIKIQRHNIYKIIHTDFKALRIVLWIARKFTNIGKELDTEALYKEVVSIIGDELNYYKELKNGQYFQRRFHDSTDYYIPQFYEEYSTGKVLVMEWIEGRKVTDIPFLHKHKIDRKVAARKLFQFFVDQLFDYGMFHADPHQGNILITQDGMIVILDFGMVGEISKEDAQHIRQMIQGFVLDDYNLVINQLKELGFLLPHANKHKLQTLLKTYIDMYIEKDIHHLDEKLVEGIFQDLKQIVREQPIQLPAEFAFLGRATSIGLGVLTIIDPHIDFMALGKPVVREWLDKDEERSGNIKWHFIKESVKPLLSLPRNLNEWLHAPESKRRSEETRQFQRFDHHRYLLMMSLSYVSLLLTLAFYFISIIIGNNQLQFITLSFTGLTFSFSLMTTFLHRRWINKAKQSHYF
ncbi:AarF/ABC1/UbiB kinase family protein [Salipaludibacillus agaradhaerens]|uniref:AarF/ABC1/UbiB kinase family protein n=1 Tax=Salipaludibacillus agaradhaerens TaxID=76935 RepID=A0A9Q4B2R0_SALAG|nr:lipopolysaccharide core heptose(II) kinase RfaY [Salipaludibacillus agaradhaerens]MCR6097055.1 AarF/ABC1/UbiB kinase family protein [Salipaludibacillus agaradhaerens]MCR6113460.1 AarF/ABC1/UbiB kinase family protein [Salipaludibacillus agaradhaerens]